MIGEAPVETSIHAANVVTHCPQPLRLGGFSKGSFGLTLDVGSSKQIPSSASA